MRKLQRSPSSSSTDNDVRARRSGGQPRATVTADERHSAPVFLLGAERDLSGVAGLAAGNDVFGTRHRDNALAHELTHVVQRSALVVQTAPAAMDVDTAVVRENRKRSASDAEMDLDSDLAIGEAGGSTAPSAKRQKVGPPQRSKSQDDLAKRRPRTNSILLDGSEKTEDGKRIFEAQGQGRRLLDIERNSADGLNKHREPGLTFADAAVFASFSREASRNWAKNFWKVPEEQRARIETRRGDSDQYLRAKVATTRDISNDEMSNQFRSLLADKSIPHVITVLEGREPDAGEQEIEVQMAGLAVPYKMLTHQELGSNATQTMTMYVRRDLEKVYRPRVIKILAAKDKNMTNFEALAVDYDDVAGNHFRIINVHIPNANVGTKVDDKTRKAFQEYAEKCAKEDPPVLVTCYTGDTNYKKVLVETHAPSYGGRRSDGSALSARSSGAQDETVFMQTIPFDLREILGPPADDAMDVDDALAGIPHVVLQPSTLNYIKLKDSIFKDAGDKDKVSKTDTDHPSHSVAVLHKHALANRDPSAFEKYYADGQ